MLGYRKISESGETVYREVTPKDVDNYSRLLRSDIEMLVRAELSDLTDDEYCNVNGINKRAFSYVKKIFCYAFPDYDPDDIGQSEATSELSASYQKRVEEYKEAYKSLRYKIIEEDMSILENVKRDIREMTESGMDRRAWRRANKISKSKFERNIKILKDKMGDGDLFKLLFKKRQTEYPELQVYSMYSVPEEVEIVKKLADDMLNLYNSPVDSEAPAKSRKLYREIIKHTAIIDMNIRNRKADTDE